MCVFSVSLKIGSIDFSKSQNEKCIFRKGERTVTSSPSSSRAFSFSVPLHMSKQTNWRKLFHFFYHEGKVNMNQWEQNDDITEIVLSDFRPYCAVQNFGGVVYLLSMIIFFGKKVTLTAH